MRNVTDVKIKFYHMSLSVEDHHFEKNNLKFTVYLHNTPSYRKNTTIDLANMDKQISVESTPFSSNISENTAIRHHEQTN
uniref:Uncharacterized protein n=1 Tax=Daphnia galeata TaxID=27404 RepID=A0A8J2WKP3_9CRUS|nr:unnamed protein product [Daphnia galeata]